MKRLNFVYWIASWLTVLFFSASAQQIQVTVDQKLSDGTSVDSVGRWLTNHYIRYKVPKEFTFTIGTNEVLLSTRKIISGQKYNNWNNDPDVTNHHHFAVTTGFPTLLVAWFEPTKPGITMTNNFLSSPPGSNPPDDSLNFKDPWLVRVGDPDYNDPPYGYRNLGLSAVFETNEAPFNPNTNPSGTGSEYKGVFLSQGSPNWQPPFYSVRAIDNQQVTVNGKSITWDWESWSYNPAEIDLQYPNSKETAVVFKQDGATLTAG